METKTKYILIYVVSITLIWVLLRVIISRRYGKIKNRIKVVSEPFEGEIPVFIDPDTKDADFDVSNPPIKIKAFGTVLNDNPAVEKKSMMFKTSRRGDKELPKTFDGRVKWKDLLSPVGDQGACGNCWAWASACALADRFAILSTGAIKFIPSPAEMTICSKDFKYKTQWGNEKELRKMDDDLHINRACNGNALPDIANSIYTDGITTYDCIPIDYPVGYGVVAKNTSSGIVNPSGGGTGGKSPYSYEISAKVDTKYSIPRTREPKELPYCIDISGLYFDRCLNSKKAMRKYRASTVYNLEKSANALMYDIYKYGPTMAGFMVFPSFVSPGYTGKKIYTREDTLNSDAAGGHAIRVVGWGEEEQGGRLVKYWIIANSWGTDWGEDGYFKLERGGASTAKDSKGREIPDRFELEGNMLSFLPDFKGFKIQDSNVIPIDDIDEVNYRKWVEHSIDPEIGFYDSALNKMKTGELDPDSTPLIPVGTVLPDYSTFYAGEIAIQSKLSSPSPPSVVGQIAGDITITDLKKISNNDMFIFNSVTNTITFPTSSYLKDGTKTNIKVVIPSTGKTMSYSDAKVWLEQQTIIEKFANIDNPEETMKDYENGGKLLVVVDILYVGFLLGGAYMYCKSKATTPMLSEYDNPELFKDCGCGEDKGKENASRLRR